MIALRFNNGQRPFYKDLNARVKAHFESPKRPNKGDHRLHKKAAIIVSLYIISYAIIIGMTLPSWAMMVVYTFHGLATALVGFNVMHDGAHSSFSQNKYINRLTAYTFNVIGSHAHYWQNKHNSAHHMFTNVEGADEDVNSFSMLRMTPHQPHLLRHKFQHIYALPLYSLTTIFWFFVLDFKAYFLQTIANHPMAKGYSLKEKLIFWASKLLYCTLYLLIPASILGWQTALLGFLLMHLVLGFIFAVVFQLAHVVEKTQFPRENPETGIIDSEWAVHQLATTADFATDSTFWTWSLGGLNFQVEHHLFPRISHVHYPDIKAIVMQTCKDHDIEYLSYPTFYSALKSHLAHLKRLGKHN
jgi:linoleoyl-CoA desaturase